MKNLIYTILALSIVFASCKKEDDVVAPTVIIGCTDVLALNYNPNAIVDNGFCSYTIVISGCMDSIATNYNLLATEDDSSCKYGISGGKWIGNSHTYDIIMTQWDSSQTNILFTMSFLETENNPDSLDIQQIKFFLNHLEVKTYDNQGIIDNEGNWVEENEGTTNHSITITDNYDGETIVFNVENINEENLVLSSDIDEMEYDQYENTWIQYIGTVEHSFDRNKNGLTINNKNQQSGKKTWSYKNRLMNNIKK